jgi:hypothetical protein
LVLYLFIFVGKAFNYDIKKVVGRGEIEGIYHVLLTCNTLQHYIILLYVDVMSSKNQGWAMEIVNSLVILLLRFKEI